MTKLTKTQQRIYDDAITTIDFCRTHTIREWAIKHENLSNKRMSEEPEFCEKWINNCIKDFGKYYESYKTGRVLAIANTRSLLALEKAGLIKVELNPITGVDWVQVLNY